MPRPAHSVHDMEIDEISLVDVPANQHAKVLITKRHQEDGMPEDDDGVEVFDESGEPVDVDALSNGAIVFDAEGNPFQYVEDDGNDADNDAFTGELAGVSKAFASPPTYSSLGQSLRSELSKAVSEADREVVLAKALNQVDELAKANNKVWEIAKSEQDLRLEREYIAKAATYTLPVAAEELGPVMKRMAEAMSYEDCAVIAKVFDATSEILFSELGITGDSTEAGQDPYYEAVAHAEQIVAKAAKSGDTELAKAASIEDFYAANPAAYDEYLNSRG